MRRELKIAFIFSGYDFRTEVNSLLVMDLFSGMHTAAARYGVFIDRFDIDNPVDSFYRKGLHKNYDGIIGAIVAVKKWQTAWQAIEREKPCVNILFETGRADTVYAGSDEEYGTGIIVDHLYREGHRSIGYALSCGEPYAMRRYEGYLAAIRRHNIPVSTKWIYRADTAYLKFLTTPAALTVDGMEQFRNTVARRIGNWLVTMRTRPSAIMLDSVLDAVYVRQHLDSEGIRVPDDIAITAFDDEPRQTAAHSITTVRQNFSRIGSESVRLIASRVRGRLSTPKTVSVKPALVVRNSSRRTAGVVRNDSQFKDAVRSYVEKNYHDDNAKNVALFFGMHRDSFGRKCRRVLGVPYLHILNEYRLAKAASLLTDTKRPVTDIVYESGFHNYQHFNALFRNKFSLSPGAYRKRRGE
ncbi:MAG: substrate-binding domain-containing protein [Spirochaetes bacterium]|nr:substrate-binding domain-containing protein [Spirochaetota bacterium]